MIHLYRRCHPSVGGGLIPEVEVDDWILVGEVAGGVWEGSFINLLECTWAVRTPQSILLPPQGYSAVVGAPLMWSRGWVAFPLHPQGESTQCRHAVNLVVPAPWVRMGFWGRAVHLFKVIFGILPDVGAKPFSAVLHTEVTETTSLATSVPVGAPALAPVPTAYQAV